MTGAIAIIPARGGSKGIPGKNLKLVGGRPLIQWSIEAAQLANLPAYVSSDSREILDLSFDLGGLNIQRPAELADDTASTESVVLHAMRTRSDVASCEYIVLLQPTSPIRRFGEIEAALMRLRESGADSLFSARRVEGFVWFERTNGWEPTYDPVRREMRQATTTKLEENGSIYIFKPWVLEKLNSRLGGKIVAHEMHPLDSFQVDEPSDLDLMEQLIPLRMPQAVLA
jgi:N-acylneuraminate cytidylyltransferase